MLAKDIPKRSFVEVFLELFWEKVPLSILLKESTAV